MYRTILVLVLAAALAGFLHDSERAVPVHGYLQLGPVIVAPQNVYVRGGLFRVPRLVRYDLVVQLPPDFERDPNFVGPSDAEIHLRFRRAGSPATVSVRTHASALFRGEGISGTEIAPTRIEYSRDLLPGKKKL